ncbi:unnamed protein product, partial [Oppiella nova]
MERDVTPFIGHKLTLKTYGSHRCLSGISPDTTIQLTPQVTVTPDTENVIDLSAGALDASTLAETIVNTSDLPVTALN